MMRKLKRYEDFIKESEETFKTPEASEFEDDSLEDDIDSDVDMDAEDSIIDEDDDISELRDEIGEDIEDDDIEEEEGEYIGTKLLNELAEKLGVEVVDNKIEYNDMEINFYSEDEKFHIGREKFETIDEVLEFLTSGENVIDSDESDVVADNEMDFEQPEGGEMVMGRDADQMMEESAKFRRIKRFR